MNATKPTKKEVKKGITKEQLLEAREALFDCNRRIEEAKAEQLQIREYLADFVHDGDEGAKTVTIDGIKLTVTRNLRRTITREEAERFTQEHGELSLTCLRWNPEVRVGEYKKHAEILDEYIETKPAPPEVKFA